MPSFQGQQLSSISRPWNVINNCRGLAYLVSMGDNPNTALFPCLPSFLPSQPLHRCSPTMPIADRSGNWMPLFPADLRYPYQPRKIYFQRQMLEIPQLPRGYPPPAPAHHPLYTSPIPNSGPCLASINAVRFDSF